MAYNSTVVFRGRSRLTNGKNHLDKKLKEHNMTARFPSPNFPVKS
jgi:hypothetical protein